MSNIKQQDDAATLRAVMSALGGNVEAEAEDAVLEPKAEADVPAEAPVRQQPHLRVVADSPTPEPTATPEQTVKPRRPAPAAQTALSDAGIQADDGVTAFLDSLGSTAGDDVEESNISALVADAAPKPGLKTRLAAEWERWRPMRPFLFATLLPVPLLLAAGSFGGIFSFLAFIWMTCLLYVIDEIGKRRGIKGPDPIHTDMADRLSVVLGALHFGLLAFGVWALSGATGLGFFGWIGTFLALGLWFGQVSNSNAHELIHRSDKRLFRLGMWVYISLLFGHHTSAHRLVHHRFVATVDDPNTAAKGENFYLFAARAWPGAFVAGYEMEQHLREKRKTGDWRDMNPYTVYIAGALGFVGLVLVLFGFDGLLAYLLLCAYAQVQLLLSDYVQHYGLLRRKLPSGTLEPAGAQHSWDARHPFSSMMMLNAPRHADHHAHPARPYTELRLSPGNLAPILPYSLPAMAAIALVPPYWHKIMDRRLSRLGV